MVLKGVLLFFVVCLADCLLFLKVFCVVLIVFNGFKWCLIPLGGL